MNRLARERSPYLLQHAQQSRRLVSVGRRGVRPGAPRGQADLPVDRLLDLPLVPRDGARIVRERRDRRGAQRSVRRDQSGSRGAARRRSRLHDVRAGDHRIRRLADERVAHARAEAVLRRHLFSAGIKVGTAGLRRHPAGDRAGVEGRTRQGRRLRRCPDRPAPIDGAGVAVGGRSGRGCARENRPAVPRRLRSPPRRLRRCAEISATVRAVVPAARARAGHGAASGARWCCARCGRWRWAACAITSAAAFIATRSIGEWRVPHFEKMLYDQAQLVLAFVEASQVSGDPFYLEVAEDTLLYVMREMTDAGRRLLLRRGRRQHPAGGGRFAGRSQEGRRLLSVDRGGARCAARSRMPGS